MQLEQSLTKEQIELLNKNRPKKQSPIGMAYYRREYAELVLQMVQQFKAEPKKKFSWLSSITGLSPTTLYLRWNQGARYAKDNLSHEVTKDLEKVRVNKEDRGPKAGVHFRFIESFFDKLALVSEVEDDTTWKEDVAKWITNAKPREKGVFEIDEVEYDEDYLNKLLPTELFLFNYVDGKLSVLCLDDSLKAELNQQ